MYKALIPARTASPDPGDGRAEAREGASGRLSVVMVYYGGDDARVVLDDLLADPAVGEVVLVNNWDGPPWPAALGPAPQDRSAEGAARLRLVHGQGNVGFGCGCNLGVAAAGGDLVLLLNPDCRPAPGALSVLRALAGRQAGDAWLIGARLLNADGTEQPGARRNAGTPAQWLGEALGGPLADRLGRVNRHREPVPSADLVPMPAVSGAFMLLPRAFYRRLEGFDPGYFLHFEDLALCRAVWRAGGRVLFAPHVVAVHLKSRSPVPNRVVSRHKIRSFRRFLRTEFAGRGCPAPALWGVWALLSAGLLARPGLARLSALGRRVGGRKR